MSPVQHDVQRLLLEERVIVCDDVRVVAFAGEQAHHHDLAPDLALLLRALDVAHPDLLHHERLPVLPALHPNRSTVSALADLLDLLVGRAAAAVANAAEEGNDFEDVFATAARVFKYLLPDYCEDFKISIAKWSTNI